MTKKDQQYQLANMGGSEFPLIYIKNPGGYKDISLSHFLRALNILPFFITCKRKPLLIS